MKWIVSVFLSLLLISASAFPQTAVIASRRREKTPLQLSFGSFTAIAPYNNSAGYTVVSDAQIQPSTLISDNNTFSSTGNFTTIEKDDASASFTVSSNVGTVTTGSAASANYILGSSASSFSVPDVFIEMEITQNGSASGTDIIGLGLMSSTVQLNAEINHVSNTAYIHTFAGGSHTVFAVVSFTVPTAPWFLGFSMVGTLAKVWANSGSGWQLITAADISSKYDPTVAGNLSGLESAFKLFTSNIVTWKFANLKAGAYGGLGIRDISVVQYTDGRPYFVGSKIYFLATIAGAAGTKENASIVFSLDLSNNTLTPISMIAIARSGHVYMDTAGEIIYEPLLGTERFLIATWGSSAYPNINILYTSFSTGTLDLLSSGIHIVSGMITVSLPAGAGFGYDPSMVCSKWNYSTLTCSQWLMAYAAAFSGSNAPALQSSSGDPSSNSWTTIGEDTSNPQFEGSKIIRTATGPSGVQYWPVWGGIEFPSTIRTTRLYNSALSFQGALTVTLPPAHGGANPPWPMLFAYGNNEYYLTFDNTLFGPDTGLSNQTIGNLIVATAPKY